MLARATQMCFFLILGATECFLLAVMAYDRFVAICNPLHYPVVMNHKMCIQLAVGSWISGILVQVGQMCQIFFFHFCHSNQINHLFCDISPIRKLACGDTSVHALSVYVVALLFGAVPFVLILGYCNRTNINFLIQLLLWTNAVISVKYIPSGGNDRLSLQACSTLVEIVYF